LREIKEIQEHSSLWTTTRIGIHKSLNAEKIESSISTRNSRNRSKHDREERKIDDREKAQASRAATQPASDKTNVLSHSVFPLPLPSSLWLPNITQQYLVFNPNVKPELIKGGGKESSGQNGVASIQRTATPFFFSTHYYSYTADRPWDEIIPFIQRLHNSACCQKGPLMTRVFIYLKVPLMLSLYLSRRFYFVFFKLINYYRIRWYIPIPCAPPPLPSRGCVCFWLVISGDVIWSMWNELHWMTGNNQFHQSCACPPRFQSVRHKIFRN
jgi:hypothetical protein